ncbi:phospholipid ABC transporter ATP-binding protein MlaF, partial [Vibrio sp. 10N.261.49.A5]
LTSIVVSHDVPEVMSIADWVYLMADGKIIAAGAPDELYNNSDPRVQQFLQGDADGPVPFRFPAKSLKEDLF